MSVNIEQIIDRLRNQSPLLGRHAREYIADALEGLFTAHISRHGISRTAANVAEKVVIQVTPVFEHPQRGTKISIVFDHENTAANPTLRIGATEARPIVHLSNWSEGATVMFVFDGENWRMINAKTTTTIHPRMDDGNGEIGTDNGQYANADHKHPVHTNHDTSHITTGRFIPSRLPTSETANRVLAVGTANTDPAFQQVNNAMIADDAIRTRHILNQNVTAEKIADDAVQTRHILDQNVTTPKIADLAVTEPKIDNDAVQTRHILDQNVTTPKIADLAITEPKIADDAVQTRHILDQNVTTPKIADLAVTEPKIANNAVQTRHILDQNVTTPKIADLAVTEPKIANDAVQTRHILNQNVTTPKIADLAVTEPKIANDAVQTRHILNQNVTTPKIADLAVTEPKIANNAVQTRHILDQNVTTPKIADLSVTEPKVASDAVRTRHILSQNVTTEKIADRAVTGAKLFTSAENNTLLRVNEAGTDPVFGKIQVPNDLDGVMPVIHGGTGADNPEGARENLGAAGLIDLQAHIETQMAHGRHPVTTYGPYNVHQEAVNITIDENKRLTLAANGNFHAHDDIADHRITSWLQKRVGAAGTSGFQTTIMAGWGTVRIDETAGEDAGFAGLTEAHVFFHRDNTLYKIVVLSWADNSNTTTTRPNALTRLQNAIIKVEKLLDRP